MLMMAAQKRGDRSLPKFRGVKVYALDDDVCLGDQTKAYAIDNELEVVACGRVPELELGRSVCCTELVPENETIG